MNTGNYRIAHLEIRLLSRLPERVLSKSWKQFEYTDAPDRPDFQPWEKVQLRVLSSSVNHYQIEPFALSEPAETVFRFHGDILFTDAAWTRCTILPLQEPLSFPVFTNQIFLTHAIRHSTLQLHASLIDDQGRGVVFLGPSGVGKTTQAERWAEYRGAAILNGDMVFIQKTPDGYLGWGTPWHGSSPYCLNTSVPVKALVVLKQAPENRLRKLTGFEKVAEISGSVFYPTWLEDGMDLCSDTLNHLLTDLPVYRLDNRADREAVDLLARELGRLTEGEKT